MPKKLKPLQLLPEIFADAGKELLDGQTSFSCNAIQRALRTRFFGRSDAPYSTSSSVELDFYERLFGINESWVFSQMVDDEDQVLPLQLMALALAYTLAVEQNRGRRIL